MEVILIMLVGLFAPAAPAVGDGCAGALHSLRVDSSMMIVSTETLVKDGKHRLVYTLTEDKYLGNDKNMKTVIMQCGYPYRPPVGSPL